MNVREDAWMSHRSCRPLAAGDHRLFHIKKRMRRARANVREIPQMAQPMIQRSAPKAEPCAWIALTSAAAWRIAPAKRSAIGWRRIASAGKACR